jgi:hypothetical protein
MEKARMPVLVRTALVGAIALYVASLFLPTFCRTAGACNDWPGFSVLLIGWFEVLLARDVGPFVALAWLANPLFVAAVVTLSLGKYRPAMLWSLSALLLGVLFHFGTKVVANEGGVANAIIGYGSGYWLWVTSFAVLCIGCGVGVTHMGKEPVHEEMHHGA